MRVRDMEAATSLIAELVFRNEQRPTELRWVTSDVPADARIISVVDDPVRDVVVFRVESASFDDVDRDAVPWWAPEFTLHTEPLPPMGIVAEDGYPPLPEAVPV